MSINQNNETTAAPSTGHNSSLVDTYIKIIKNGARLVGDSAANADKGLTETTKGAILAYQDDEYMRGKMNAFVHVRVNSKITSKIAKEAAAKWLEITFDETKPTAKAMSLSKFKYQNRLNAYVKAFKRAADYYKQGFRFTMDDKTLRFYITSDSYRKVTQDNTNHGDVEMVAKAGASSDRKTFSSLETGKPAAKESKGKPVTVTATAANIKVLCQATKVACESAVPDKLDGSERVAALDAFFALQIMLGAKEDTAMVKAYEELTKAQAA